MHRSEGEYANFSVFDVDTVDEWHDLLANRPLFPYLKGEGHAIGDSTERLL
ncbi:muconolactone Delta-isomerase family protein [Kribbella alba]